MAERHIEVKKLVLRMHGTDQAHAARLAREVGERMSGAQFGNGVQPGAHIHVKVDAGAGHSAATLAGRIAAAVRRQTQ